MKLAKSPWYSNHAAADIGSHADHWLIPSERPGLLNTEIIHGLQIKNVDAQSARGPVQHIFERYFQQPCRNGGDCIDTVVQSLTFKAQASAPRPTHQCIMQEQ